MNAFATTGTVHADVLAALSGLAAVVSRLRGTGPLAGAALSALGLVLLVAADRLRRPVAFLGGAAVGWIAIQLLAERLPSSLSVGAASGLAAVAAGAASAGAPMLFPALAGALVGAVLGVHVPVGGSAGLGAVIAGAVGAALLAVGARSAAIILAAVAGGCALGAGALAMAGGRELAVELAARPFMLLGFALWVGVAGAAFQLSGDNGDRKRPVLPATPRLPRE
jgi:hypothetical protein